MSSSDTAKLKARAAHAEEQVARALAQAGWSILTTNYRIPGGEVDLFAAKGETLVAVEVKCRQRLPADLTQIPVVISTKQRRALARATRAYLAHCGTAWRAVRCDLAVITPTGDLRYYPDAVPLEDGPLADGDA